MQRFLFFCGEITLSIHYFLFLYFTSLAVCFLCTYKSKLTLLEVSWRVETVSFSDNPCLADWFIRVVAGTRKVMVRILLDGKEINFHVNQLALRTNPPPSYHFLLTIHSSIHFLQVIRVRAKLILFKIYYHFFTLN